MPPTSSRSRPEIVAKIIEKERPDALLPTMGGQTALNCALSLRRMGVLDKFGVEDDRRDRRRDRQGGRPRAVPRGDEEDRPRNAEIARSPMHPISSKLDRDQHTAQIARIKAPEACAGRGGAGARRVSDSRWDAEDPARKRRYIEKGLVEALEALSEIGLPAIIRPVLHARRHRRRHRLQQGRVLRDRRARARRIAHHRSPDRGVRARLEGIRDGGGARSQRQLHHRLLDREPRSDGRAYRQFDHHRAGADAHRQGISDHARRLDRGAARDRRGDRRRRTCSSPSIRKTGGSSSSR